MAGSGRWQVVESGRKCKELGSVMWQVEEGGGR